LEVQRTRWQSAITGLFSEKRNAFNKLEPDCVW
jgi:hypothetical protein